MQQFSIPILIALITAVTVAIAILRMRGEHHARHRVSRFAFKLQLGFGG